MVAGSFGNHRGPKPFDVAIVAGSVVPFTCSDRALVAQSAERLRIGVGWRTGEGFGQAVLDHPIHWSDWTAPTRSRSVIEDRRESLAKQAAEIAKTLARGGIDHTDVAAVVAVQTTGARVDEQPRPRHERSEHPQARAAHGAGIGDRTRMKHEKILETLHSVPEEDRPEFARQLKREMLVPRKQR